MSAPRCRGLYYDAVRTSCGHVFCKPCIQPFSDCLVCGADIALCEPEPRLQGALHSLGTPLKGPSLYCMQLLNTEYKSVSMCQFLGL